MTAQTADYRVELPVFDGPLDLLVHLVKKNQIDIADIPIHLIVTQYMSYLTLAREADLQLATSFFEMAATLLAIKAAMLLPRAATDEEEDPRTDLAEQIRAHEEVLRLKEEITRRLADGENALERPPTVLRSTQVRGGISAGRLQAVWERLTEWQEREASVHTIAPEVVSAAAVEAELKERLRAGTVDILQYLLSLPQKLHQITAFLIILEEVRRGRIFLADDGAALYMKGSHEYINQG